MSFLSAFLSGFSTIGSIYNTQETNTTNSRINKENLAFNREENEKSRAFTDAQRIASQEHQLNLLSNQQAFQNQQRLAQESFQKQQNDPAYQAARLRAAGINPAVYFGGNSSVQTVSAPSGSSPAASSAPSGSSAPVLGAPSMIPMQAMQIPQLVSGAAQMVKSIADARKSGVETGRIETFLDEEMRSLILKNRGQEFLNDIQETESLFRRLSLPADVSNRFAQLEIARQQLLNARDEQQVIRAEKDLKDSRTALNKSMSDLNGMQRLLVQKQVDTFDENFKSKMANERSERALNDASVKSLFEKTRIDKVIADVRESGKSDEVNAWLFELRKKNMVSSEEYESARQELERLEHLDNRTEFAKRVDAVITRIARNIQGKK